MNYSYVAIEGLIGAGKTTLARILAEKVNARIILEEFDENPFLPSFYAEPDRYAFSVELSFLAQRYHQLKRAAEVDLFQPNIIADYSIGKSLVFAQATLPADELKLFRELYDIMYGGLRGPELIVYVHVSQERLKHQIASRGRSYEQEISNTYLEKLYGLYMDHLNKLSGKRVVILDIEEIDLRNDSKACSQIYELLCQDIQPGVSVMRLSEL